MVAQRAARRPAHRPPVAEGGAQAGLAVASRRPRGAQGPRSHRTGIAQVSASRGARRRRRLSQLCHFRNAARMRDAGGGRGRRRPFVRGERPRGAALPGPVRDPHRGAAPPRPLPACAAAPAFRERGRRSGGRGAATGAPGGVHERRVELRRFKGGERALLLRRRPHLRGRSLLPGPDRGREARRRRGQPLLRPGARPGAGPRLGRSRLLRRGADERPSQHSRQRGDHRHERRPVHRGAAVERGRPQRAGVPGDGERSALVLRADAARNLPFHPRHRRRTAPRGGDGGAEPRLSRLRSVRPARARAGLAALARAAARGLRRRGDGGALLALRSGLGPRLQGEARPDGGAASRRATRSPTMSARPVRSISPTTTRSTSRWKARPRCRRRRGPDRG